MVRILCQGVLMWCKKLYNLEIIRPPLLFVAGLFPFVMVVQAKQLAQHSSITFGFGETHKY